MSEEQNADAEQTGKQSSIRDGLIKDLAVHAVDHSFMSSAAMIRSCFILNGGACVALLAFLGDMYGKVSTGFTIASGVAFVLGCIATIFCLYYSGKAENSLYDDVGSAIKVTDFNLKGNILIVESQKQEKIRKEENKFRANVQKYCIGSVICFIFGVVLFGIALGCYSDSAVDKREKNLNINMERVNIGDKLSISPEF